MSHEQLSISLLMTKHSQMKTIFVIEKFGWLNWLHKATNYKNLWMKMEDLDRSFIERILKHKCHILVRRVDAKEGHSAAVVVLKNEGKG